jgi:two-component system, OmpR family, response regulator BaeR
MSPPLVLVIDDEPAIADVVEYVLQEQGFAVERATDGHDGWRRFESRRPALVLLDLNLPGRDGLDLFRSMRAARPDVPVIMLTSRTDDVDRVLGLELGADDYVTKPFHARELAARVKAVLRRLRRPAGDGVRAHGPFRLDDAQRVATYFDEILTLTRGEFLLLAALLRHPARTFTRDALLQHLHGDEAVTTDRAVDALIRRLRRKLEDVRPGLDPVETVYGVGYKIRHGIEEWVTP